MIKIRYRDPNELSPGLHAEAERRGRCTTVYLLSGLTKRERRAALRRLRLSARMGYCPSLPAPQLALALLKDRIRTGAGQTGAVFRLHPAGSTVPIMVLSGGAIAFLLLSTVSIRVLHPRPQDGLAAAGTPPIAAASAIPDPAGSSQGQEGSGLGNQGVISSPAADIGPGSAGSAVNPAASTGPGAGGNTGFVNPGGTGTGTGNGTGSTGTGGTGTGTGTGGSATGSGQSGTGSSDNGGSSESSGSTKSSGSSDPSSSGSGSTGAAAAATAPASAATQPAATPAATGSSSGGGGSGGGGVCLDVGPLGVCLDV